MFLNMSDSRASNTPLPFSFLLREQLVRREMYCTKIAVGRDMEKHVHRFSNISYFIVKRSPSKQIQVGLCRLINHVPELLSERGNMDLLCGEPVRERFARKVQ